MKNDTWFSSTKRSNICKRLWVFVIASNMDKNVGKNIREYLSSKYSQKRLDNAKQYPADTVKTA